jgi:hypothetical protein
MKKKISFISMYPELEIRHPEPASRHVPEWYRETPGVNDGIMTVKKCVPFLDALTSGYIIPTTADVWKRKDVIDIWADSKVDVVSKHLPQQTNYYANDPAYDTQPYKWINHFLIKTPRGYSTLFIHPVNNTELPFYSFTGVVDTDKHPIVVNFPFLIKKDFDGKIPAGTPMIQAIPFKRSDWNMEVIDDQKPPYYKKQYEVMNPPFGWYKRKWWQKKLYS